MSDKTGKQPWHFISSPHTVSQVSLLIKSYMCHLRLFCPQGRRLALGFVELFHALAPRCPVRITILFIYIFNIVNRKKIYYYYMLELSYYWYSLVAMFYEPRMKDFWQMFFHHLCTLLLITFSYYYW